MKDGCPLLAVLLVMASLLLHVCQGVRAELRLKPKIVQSEMIDILGVPIERSAFEGAVVFPIYGFSGNDILEVPCCYG